MSVRLPAHSFQSMSLGNDTWPTHWGRQASFLLHFFLLVYKLRVVVTIAPSHCHSTYYSPFSMTFIVFSSQILLCSLAITQRRQCICYAMQPWEMKKDLCPCHSALPTYGHKQSMNSLLNEGCVRTCRSCSTQHRCGNVLGTFTVKLISFNDN